VPPLDPNRPAPRSSADIFVVATANAAYTQHVEITDNQKGGFNVFWSGSADGKVIGQANIPRKNHVVSYTVTVTHTPNPIQAIYPNLVKNPVKTRKGNYTEQVVAAEDGKDADYNDAVITFRYLDNTEEKPGKLPPNSVKVDIPALDPKRPVPKIAGATELFICATSHAGNTQHVTITDNQGYKVTWNGAGEGKLIGSDRIPRKDHATTYIVTISSSAGGAQAKPSQVKPPTKSQAGIFTEKTVLSEDGTDDDYDDLIVDFRYHDNSPKQNPHAYQAPSGHSAHQAAQQHQAAQPSSQAQPGQQQQQHGVQQGQQQDVHHQQHQQEHQHQQVTQQSQQRS